MAWHAWPDPLQGPTDDHGLTTTTLVDQPDAGLLDLDLRPDGRELAVVTASGELLRFDVSTNGPPSAEAKPPLDSSVVSPDDGVWSVAYSPDGRRLATGDAEGRMTLVEADSGRLICRTERLGVDVLRVRFTGSTLARIGTSDLDYKTTSWNDDCTSSTLFLGHRDVVWDFLFTPGGDYLVTVSDDGSMRLWDPGSARDALHSRVTPGRAFKRIAAVSRRASASGDARIRVATAAWNGTDTSRGVLTLWDIAPPAERETLHRTEAPYGEPAADHDLLARARDLAIEPRILEDQTLDCLELAVR